MKRSPFLESSCWPGSVRWTRISAILGPEINSRGAEATRQRSTYALAQLSPRIQFLSSTYQDIICADDALEATVYQLFITVNKAVTAILRSRKVQILVTRKVTFRVRPLHLKGVKAEE
ncbi:hypothetical protein NDU88_004581 [Pleurodeles waltl]|uniref:Uncharacterized protein n=1 Tax=Pleurodeles waltl TaxID=8319 RepID=A0AAV7SJ89_PLEWA|nr:hypothetical protein NDU88_004581 [Pleurodeles waltl]